jgi:hypothetical protein
MSDSRSAGRVLRLAALAAAMALCGCSIHDDPDYNPYAPTDGDPTFTKRVDQGAEAVSQALDNLDRRFDNTID